jgi:sugar-specific transcriptional regulator TrmB
LDERGFSAHERDLYALSISLAPTGIAALAEHLGMPRPNVYKVIAGLERKGLAVFSEKTGYQKTFAVESPSVVVEKLRAHREALEKTTQDFLGELPGFIAQYRQGEMPAKFRIIQGEKQFWNAYLSVFEEAQGQLAFFGSVQDFFTIITKERWSERIGRRVSLNLKIRVLALPGPQAEEMKKEDKKELRETRIFKGKKSFCTSFYLYGNKVIFWQPKTPIALLIEDEYIVAMIQDMFEVLWEVTGETSAK